MEEGGSKWKKVEEDGRMWKKVEEGGETEEKQSVREEEERGGVGRYQWKERERGEGDRKVKGW